MTPDDILQDLRDIHLPEAEAAPSGGLAPEPLLVFAVVAIVLLAVRLVRRHRWRLDALSRLRRIDAVPDPTLRWQALVGLLHQIATRVPAGRPPDAAFRPPGRASRADADALGRHLRKLLRR